MISDNEEYAIWQVETLLPNLSVADNEGNTVLHTAAAMGKTSLIPALLEAGVDVWVENHEGIRPSEFAEMEGHDKIAEILQASEA